MGGWGSGIRATATERHETLVKCHKDQTRVPSRAAQIVDALGFQVLIRVVKGQRSRGEGVKAMLSESQQCLVLISVFILSNDWKL